VNFYFQNKEQLLIKILGFLADEYRDNRRSALAKAGPRAADRLLVLVRADFDPAVCNRKKIAVWYAFWGEATSRPTYRKLYADRDRDYAKMMAQIMACLVDEGPLSLRPAGPNGERHLRVDQRALAGPAPGGRHLHSGGSAADGLPLPGRPFSKALKPALWR